MSDPGPIDVKRSSSVRHDSPQPTPSSGPNLFLIYGLIVLALIAAIGFAALIVLPFYNRR